VKEEAAKMKKRVAKRPLGRGSWSFFLLLFYCSLFDGWNWKSMHV